MNASTSLFKTQRPRVMRRRASKVPTRPGGQRRMQDGYAPKPALTRESTTAKPATARAGDGYGYGEAEAPGARGGPRQAARRSRGEAKPGGAKARASAP